MKKALGVDVGGTGIKMAIVDTATGELLTERIKVLTPHLGMPTQIADVVKNQMSVWDISLPVGIGFPTPLRGGVCTFHSNLSPLWEGMHVANFFSNHLGTDVHVANDVDTAALAELHWGDVNKELDKVIFLALGTGIGSALIHKGNIWYGSELGHLKYKKSIIEDYASNRVREVQGLSWKVWGKRLNKVLNHMDFVLDADEYILGGGVSKKFEKYEKYLDLQKPVKPAKLLNSAGVVGAAMLTI